ncbi:hypothetical protein [Novosphingobium organovorum]|nr:hypothetical protein [Novosphingobium organovorum]
MGKNSKEARKPGARQAIAKKHNEAFHFFVIKPFKSKKGAPWISHYCTIRIHNCNLARLAIAPATPLCDSFQDAVMRPHPPPETPERPT